MNLTIPNNCEFETRLSGARDRLTATMKFPDYDDYCDWDSEDYSQFLKDLIASAIDTVLFIFPDEIAGIRRVTEVTPIARRGRQTHTKRTYFEPF